MILSLSRKDKEWVILHLKKSGRMKISLNELKISANSEFVSVYQSCYIQDKELEKIADKIRYFVENYCETCYS